MPVLRAIPECYPKTRGRYGFVEAFKPLTGWYNLVQPGCARNRFRNHDADGGKCALRICLGRLHEDQGCGAGDGESWIQSWWNAFVVAVLSLQFSVGGKRSRYFFR